MGPLGDREGSSDLLNGGQTNSGPRLSELLLRVSAGDSGGRKTERADRAQGQEVPSTRVLRKRRFSRLTCPLPQHSALLGEKNQRLGG